MEDKSDYKIGLSSILKVEVHYNGIGNMQGNSKKIRIVMHDIYICLNMQIGLCLQKWMEN